MSSSENDIEDMKQASRKRPYVERRGGRLLADSGRSTCCIDRLNPPPKAELRWLPKRSFNVELRCPRGFSRSGSRGAQCHTALFKLANCSAESIFGATLGKPEASTSYIW